MKKAQKIFLDLLKGGAAAEEYTYYEYAESDSRGQYVDMAPVAPSYLDNLIMIFAFPEAPAQGANTYFFGSRKSGCDMSLQINTAGSIVGRYGTGIGNFGITPAVGELYSVSIESNIWKCWKADGSGTTQTRTFSEQTFTSDVSYVLFGYNNNGVIVPTPLRIKGLLVHNPLIGSALVAPARRNADGKTGFVAGSGGQAVIFFPSVNGELILTNKIPKPF